MTRESACVATLRAALGKDLAYRRERSGFGQRELAEHLYYDRASISKIEAGQQSAPRTFWRGADTLLRADGELLGALDAAKASRSQAGMRPDDHRGGRSAEMLTVALTAVPSTSADPDQVDAVIELEALPRALAEHMGQPAGWVAISLRRE